MSEFLAVGGPLDGQMLIRRPEHGFKGVLLVDKPANNCWIYEWSMDDQKFHIRDKAPMEVHRTGPLNRYRAAFEDNYDVVAAPWVVSDGDPGQ